MDGIVFNKNFSPGRLFGGLNNACFNLFSRYDRYVITVRNRKEKVKVNVYRKKKLTENNSE